MIKFIKSLPYHFKTAVKSFGRHFAMSLSSASAVAVTLTLMGVFMLLAGNVGSFTNNIESGIKIRVTIDPAFEKEDEDTLKTQIEAIDGVTKITYTTRDQELKAYVKEKGEIWNLYEGDGNPLRNVFTVEIAKNKKSEIEDVATKLRGLSGAEKVFYGDQGVNDMISIFGAIRNGGAIFIVALSILTIFLIQNTIKVTIYARNREISIMRNVGATNWFIKTPFMIEGMFIGVVGAIIPIAITYFGYAYLYHEMGGIFFTKMFTLQPTNTFALTLCGVLLLAGVLVGMIGSFLSVTKYLKWKR